MFRNEACSIERMVSSFFFFLDVNTIDGTKELRLLRKRCVFLLFFTRGKILKSNVSSISSMAHCQNRLSIKLRCSKIIYYISKVSIPETF